MLKAQGYPYRTAFVPAVDPVSVPKKISKLIQIKTWFNSMKDIFPMHLAKILFLSFISLAALISIGALYDINNPNSVGIRVCASVACGLIALITGGLAIDKMASGR